MQLHSCLNRTIIGLKDYIIVGLKDYNEGLGVVSTVLISRIKATKSTVVIGEYHRYND